MKQLVVDSSVLLAVLVGSVNTFALSFLLETADRVLSTDNTITEAALVLKRMLPDADMTAPAVAPDLLKVLGLVDQYVPSLDLVEEAFLESAKLWVEPSFLLEPLLARRLGVPLVTYHADRRSVSEKLGVSVY